MNGITKKANRIQTEKDNGALSAYTLAGVTHDGKVDISDARWPYSIRSI